MGKHMTSGIAWLHTGAGDDLAAAAAAGAGARQTRVKTPLGAVHRPPVPVRFPYPLPCGSDTAVIRPHHERNHRIQRLDELYRPLGSLISTQRWRHTHWVLTARDWRMRRSLERSGHQACEAAAGDAVAFLRDWLGPRILAGRLTEEQIALMHSSPRVPPPAPGSLGAAAGLPGPSGLQD